VSFTILWLRAFALTLAIEGAVAFPLLSRVEPSSARRLGAILVANLATHPLVWFFFPRLGWAWPTVMLVAEVWAFGFEIVAYRVIFAGASWARCALVSVAANGASLLVGLGVAKTGLLG